MITLLAAWTFRSLALACIIGVVLRLAGVRNPYVRKTVWTATLAAALLMPLLMELQGVAIRAPIPVLVPRIASPGLVISHAAPPVFEVLYLLSVLLFAGHYAVALLRMARVRARAGRVSGAWTQGLDVRSTAALRAPATFARTILLPPGCERWSAEQRAAVIAHERAHVLGFDCYRLWLARLYVCLCWFNPLSWWLARRLGALAEETSDAAAMKALGDGPRYAETLLEFAARAATPTSPVVAAIARSNLPARIERIIGGEAPPAPPRRWRSSLAVLGLMPVLVFCALLQSQSASWAHAATAPINTPGHHSGLHVPASAVNLRIIRKGYPAAAARAGITGWAYVRVRVDPQGHVIRTWLVGAVPADAGFGPAALRVARTLHYRNPTGRTVVSMLPVKFALSVPRRAPPKRM